MRWRDCVEWPACRLEACWPHGSPSVSGKVCACLCTCLCLAPPLSLSLTLCHCVPVSRSGLESSTPVVVKTLQLIGKLLPTASAQFKRRLKAAAAAQIAAAKVRSAVSDALARRASCGGGRVILRTACLTMVCRATTSWTRSMVISLPKWCKSWQQGWRVR